MKNFEPCYMCNRVAVTTEHVPPKAFFPDDERKGLVTVPSCELHNTQKSGDDEYLRLVIASLISGNEVARKKVWPKIMRSFSYAPSKRSLFKNLRPAKVGSVNTGIFDADYPRFEKALDAMSRGLYRHMYGFSWLEEIKIFPPHKAFFNTQVPSANLITRVVEIGVTQHLANMPQRGENPETFYFQWLGTPKAGLMRLVFYGGSVISVAFNPSDLRDLPVVIEPQGY